ncbi:MAG TPA: DUF4292 domain-containing protein [Cyclobacteriaceae bacterium]|nr:DUF4292 domain-containing protein [Cyclobacteriaceae bacterium]
MRRLILLLCVTALVLQSCSKHTSPSVPPPQRNIAIEEIDFEYFHGKARINIRDDKKEKDVKANIRIRKDSVIWMDISVVGVSGARALINQDSITIRSNVDKEYFVFEFKELSKRFNFEINYQIVQSALLGNLLYDKRPEDVVTTDGSFTVLEQNINTANIKNYINTASSKLERIELKEANTNNSLVVNYSNFQSVGSKVFPFNGVIQILYKTAAGVINNTITFEYNKAEVGGRELRFPFSIPRKYERR